jgi:sugar/nucleoside kinase (ribokinase family)
MSKILGIGGVCIDRLGIIPRIPGWDDIEYISEYSLQQGGMVATAMMAVSRLGGQAEFIGGIGDDDAGSYIVQVFQDAHVKTDRMKIFKGGSTACSFVMVHETSGKRAFVHYKGVQIKPDLDIPALDLSGIQFLHIDGYWIDTVLKTARLAKEQGITISLDPSSKLLRDANAEELFPFVDYFMPGYAFAKRITGETEPFKAAEKILKYGAKAVIVTNGADGCFIQTPETQTHIPAFDVPVVDTTGAGDTFHGAFVMGLSHGYELLSAAQFASAVAALKCTKLGGQSGIPTFHETLEFLKERGVEI